MVFPLPQTLVKTLAKNLVKNLVKYVAKNPVNEFNKKTKNRKYGLKNKLSR